MKWQETIAPFADTAEVHEPKRTRGFDAVLTTSSLRTTTVRRELDVNMELFRNAVWLDMKN